MILCHLSGKSVTGNHCPVTTRIVNTHLNLATNTFVDKAVLETVMAMSTRMAGNRTYTVAFLETFIGLML